MVLSDVDELFRTALRFTENDEFPVEISDASERGTDEKAEKMLNKKRKIPNRQAARTFEGVPPSLHLSHRALCSFLERRAEDPPKKSIRDVVENFMTEPEVIDDEAEDKRCNAAAKAWAPLMALDEGEEEMEGLLQAPTREWWEYACCELLCNK